MRELTRAAWSGVRGEAHARTVAVLAGTRDPALVKRAAKMAECRTSWRVRAHRSEPGLSRIVADQCQDRLCAACAHSRAARWRVLVDALAADAARRGRRLKFVTLTQRARAGETLADGQARCRASVVKLMRRAQWEAWLHGGGGIGRYETTWNDGRTWWHVHCHLVVDMEFAPSAELRALWESVTGDSFEADIRAADESVADELLKYLVKAATLPAAQLVEYALAMHGRREVFTFGSAYGKGELAQRLKAIVDADEDGETGEDVEVLPLATVEAWASEAEHPRSAWARAVLVSVDAQLQAMRERASARAAGREARRSGAVS